MARSIDDGTSADDQIEIGHWILLMVELIAAIVLRRMRHDKRDGQTSMVATWGPRSPRRTNKTRRHEFAPPGSVTVVSMS
jgi:hypothetical protein